MTGRKPGRDTTTARQLARSLRPTLLHPRPGASASVCDRRRRDRISKMGRRAGQHFATLSLKRLHHGVPRCVAAALVSVLRAPSVGFSSGRTMAHAGDPYCAPSVQAHFVLGIAALQRRLGANMGEPIECEQARLRVAGCQSPGGQ
jgi:hypothetical protein